MIPGSLRPTSITHGFQEFNLHTYERIAIYITLSTPNLRYTKPNDDKVSAGDIVYDLPDISIFAGSGVKGETEMISEINTAPIIAGDFNLKI